MGTRGVFKFSDSQCWLGEWGEEAETVGTHRSVTLL